MNTENNKAPEQVALKPCPNPWCEGESWIAVHPRREFATVCCTCGVEGPNAPTEAEAITAWNTRASPEGSGELVRKAVTENPFAGATFETRVERAYREAADLITSLQSEVARLKEAGERGWLIETDFGPHIHYIGLCDPHSYWREQSEKGQHTNGRAALVGIIRFCKDSNDAIRLARREDAAQLVEALGQLLTEPRIAEHEWPEWRAAIGRGV